MKEDTARAVKLLLSKSRKAGVVLAEPRWRNIKKLDPRIARKKTSDDMLIKFVSKKIDHKFKYPKAYQHEVKFQNEIKTHRRSASQVSLAQKVRFEDQENICFTNRNPDEKG